jgi:hypothetical protein
MNESVRVDLERYLAGAMSPAEQEQFLADVRRDPDALALLGRSLEDQAYLYDALRTGAEAGHRPMRDTTRIFRAARIGARPGPSGGPAAGWIIGAIAASAAVLLVLYSSTTPRPKPPARQPIARVIEIPAPPSREEPRTPAPPPVPAPAARVETPLPPPPAPAPEPPLVEIPKPPDQKPAPAPTLVMPAEKVMVAIAKIDQAAGATILDPTGNREARAGMVFGSGQGLEGAVALRFTDGTRLELAPHTLVKEIVEDAAGKRIVLAAGSLAGDIAKQPAGKPLILTTPHAVAKVLGTALRLSVDARSTRLDVKEGKVQLKRSSDNKAVDVAAGYFAVAGDGDLVAKPLPIDEIVLTPAHGETVGMEWRPVRDPAASSGAAFEALKTSNRQPFALAADASRVTYVFRADANRDYYVWVRGFAPSKVDPIKHDAVILEFLESKVTEREGINKGVAGGGERALFNGYMHGSGYWWVGGDADNNNDEQPVVVRFNRPGLQTVKLYASEVPMRIDAIWISATQKSRPEK